MSDETREALEAALDAWRRDYSGGASGRLADAMRRALATGAESSGRDEAHAQAVAEELDEETMCVCGCCRAWHRNGGTGRCDRGECAATPWCPLFRAVTSVAPRARTGGDSFDGLPISDERTPEQRARWAEAGREIAAGRYERPARTAGEETSGDAGRDGSLPSSHKPSGEALASVDTSRRAEGLESAAPSSPPSPEREGQDPFVHWDREQRELAAAERIAEERRERAKRAEADVATLAAERERYFGRIAEMEATAARSATYGEWTTSKRRIAELEGALRRARTSLVIMRCGAKGRDADGLDMSVTDIDAALTPSAAKTETDPDLAPSCVLCGHSHIVHVLDGPCSGAPDLSPCQVRCKGFVSPNPMPPEPAAKGDGAKCVRCAGHGRVCGTCLLHAAACRCQDGRAHIPCPSGATAAAGEQRWGVWSDTRNDWLRAAGREVQGTQQEMARLVEAVLNDSPVLRGKYEARPLPPAAKGER